MNSCFRAHGIRPGDIDRLKDELSATYADNTRLAVFESARVYNRYQVLFGPLNLRVFMLSVQVRELKLRLEHIDRMCRKDGHEADAAEYGSLRALKNQIALNSGMMAATRPDDLPADNEIRILTDLLTKITRLAYPLFYRDNSRYNHAMGIMHRAVGAYAHRRAARLGVLLTSASRMSDGNRHAGPEHLAELIKTEIARLRAEREQMLIQFPLSISGRMDDPAWRHGETERLLNEEQTLEHLRHSYNARLTSRMN